MVEITKQIEEEIHQSGDFFEMDGYFVKYRAKKWVVRKAEKGRKLAGFETMEEACAFILGLTWEERKNR